MIFFPPLFIFPNIPSFIITSSCLPVSSFSIFYLFSRLFTFSLSFSYASLSQGLFRNLLSSFAPLSTPLFSFLFHLSSVLPFPFLCQTSFLFLLFAISLHLISFFPVFSHLQLFNHQLFLLILSPFLLLFFFSLLYLISIPIFLPPHRAVCIRVTSLLSLVPAPPIPFQWFCHIYNLRTLLFLLSHTSSSPLLPPTLFYLLISASFLFFIVIAVCVFLIDVMMR